MGLLRGIARTAAIAGTATAVSNRVSRRQAGRWARQGREDDAPEPDDAAAPDEPDGTSTRLEQLRQLGDLKARGVLTDTEFEEQKARILQS